MEDVAHAIGVLAGAIAHAGDQHIDVDEKVRMAAAGAEWAEDLDEDEESMRAGVRDGADDYAGADDPDSLVAHAIDTLDVSLEGGARRALLHDLIAVARSDGAWDDAERALFHRIADGLGLSLPGA